MWHEIPEVLEEPQSASSETSVGSHWDLLLELDNGELLTWQIASLPDLNSLAQSLEITAKRLKNHRAIYLDYEGPISGNRGFVRRLASGVYSAGFVSASTPDGHAHPFPNDDNFRKASEPLPLERIAPVYKPTTSSKVPPERLVMELDSPHWNSPDWRLTLKVNNVAEGQYTSMTLSKRA